MNLTLCLLALYTDTSHCNTIFEIQTWWKPLIAVHNCTCIPWWRKGCYWTADIFPLVGAGRTAPQVGTSLNLPRILLPENLSEIANTSQLQVSKSTHRISSFWSLCLSSSSHFSGIPFLNCTFHVAPNIWNSNGWGWGKPWKWPLTEVILDLNVNNINDRGKG